METIETLEQKVIYYSNYIRDWNIQYDINTGEKLPESEKEYYKDIIDACPNYEDLSKYPESIGVKNPHYYHMETLKISKKDIPKKATVYGAGV